MHRFSDIFSKIRSTVWQNESLYFSSPTSIFVSKTLLIKGCSKAFHTQTHIRTPIIFFISILLPFHLPSFLQPSRNEFISLCLVNVNIFKSSSSSHSSFFLFIRSFILFIFQIFFHKYVFYLTLYFLYLKETSITTVSIFSLLYISLSSITAFCFPYLFPCILSVPQLF